MRLSGTVFCALLGAFPVTASVDLVTIAPDSFTSRFAADGQGNIWIAANPQSCTLPTLHPLAACGPIWIGKLDPTGRSLLFATYFASTTPQAYTYIAGIAADANGNIVVAAHTVAADLPIANAVQSAPLAPLTTLYIAKLAADGSRPIYATYLGGTGGTSALSLAVDNSGAAYIAATGSADFPTTSQSAHEPAPFPTVVVKLTPAGVLAYAATFPFEFSTAVKPIQVDASGNALLTGRQQLVQVAADGTRLIRTALPAWTQPSVGPWIVPRPAGGYEFVGTAGAGVPVSPGALDMYEEGTSYLRIEDGNIAHPQLPAPVNNFAVDPANRNRICAATAGGLFRSDDNGWTWTILHDGPALAVTIDPFDSRRLFFGPDLTPSGPAPQIYRSADGGADWTAALNTAPGADRITSISADPNVPGLLYAAGRTVFHSTDGGNTWDTRAVGPARQDQSPSASTSTSMQIVQADAAHAGWAYAAGFTRCIGFCPVTENLSRTEDSGANWSTATTAPDPLVSAGTKPVIAVDPKTGDVVEAVNTQALIYRNGDFTTPQILYPAETTAVAFDSEHAGTIYLAVRGYSIVKTADGGKTWTTVVQLDRPVTALATGEGGVLHAAQEPNLPQMFLTVTDASGAVTYGTYIGGPYSQINAVTGFGGRIYVAGRTQGGLPLVAPAQPTLGGGTDGFLAVFTDAGRLLWSTYIGTAAEDSIDWVLPHADGSVTVVGTSGNTTFLAQVSAEEVRVLPRPVKSRARD